MQNQHPIGTQTVPQPSKIWMRSIVLASKVALAAALIGVPPQGALANPAGEDVVAGSVDIQRRQDVTQIGASDGAIIDWHGGFDIAPHETVEFIQPGDWAHVLNRDMSSDATRIDGRLLANGRVTIANPFGIWFGDQAIVDVAHLTAAAGSLSNEDFLSGNLHFRELRGDVSNSGLIQAQRVALIGRRVANRGQIVSPDGQIVMLAGDDVWIGEFGSPVTVGLGPLDGAGAAVENDGTIDAGRGSVRMAAGDILGLAVRSRGSVRAGHIVLDGDTGAVEVSGSLDAADLGDASQGGRIEIGGDRIALRGASLDASGETGGGEIFVGGEVHGAARELRNATRTSVDVESVLRADARREGDGGRVVVWADESTRFHGEISARAGERGGHGGFVETSGRDGLDVTGARIDASAPLGRAGEWLLDPRDVEIVSSDTTGGSFNGGDPDIFTPDDSGEADAAATVDSSTIGAALNTGTDVTIKTTEPTLEQDGTISVFAQISTDIPDGQMAKLTLDADKDIVFEANIEDAAGGGALNVELEAGGDIKFDSLIITPEGRADLTAGQGSDSGQIITIIQTSEPKITAQSVTLNAATKIGSSGEGSALPFTVSTPTLDAKTAGGDIHISQTGEQDLDVASAEAGEAGNISIVNTAGSLRITGEIETDGGNVDLLTTLNSQGSIEIAATGSIDTAKDSVESADDIGGHVGLTSDSDIGIYGPIQTGGGSLTFAGDTSTASAQKDFETGGNGTIDTRLLDPNDPSALPLAVGTIGVAAFDGDIRVGADMWASTIDLFSTDTAESAVCPNSAVCFTENSISGNLPVLAAIDLANEAVPSHGIRLQAGNLGTDVERVVDARNAIFEGNDDDSNPVAFRIVQTADVLDETLPSAEAFGAENVNDLTYEIVSVRTGGTEDDPYSGTGTITLDTASKFEGADLDLSAGEAVAFDFEDTDPLSLSSLSVLVDAPLDVDAEFAPNITTDQWTIRSGDDVTWTWDFLGVPVTSLEVAAGVGGNGSLSIGDDVSLAAVSVKLSGGQAGAGDLTFGENVVLIADAIELAAGDGSSLDSQVSLVVDPAAGATTFEQTGDDRTFSITQDASIETADLPAPTAFAGGVAGTEYSLEARQGEIKIDPAASEGLHDVSKVAGTHLSMIAADGVSITTDASIRVLSATVGGRNFFNVTQGLADKIRFAPGAEGALTFRAGTSQNSASDLTFELPDAGVLAVHADSLTLYAGGSPLGVDYAKGDPSKVVIPALAANRLVFLDKDGAPGSTPDRFVFRQDAPIDATDLPGADLFGNGEGPAADFEVHSAYDPARDLYSLSPFSVILNEPLSVPGTPGSQLSALGPAVFFSASDQDLDLDARPVEISSDHITFTATGEVPATSEGADPTPARVLAGGLANASLAGYDDGGDTPSDTLPTVAVVYQTGTIQGTDLPPLAAWQGGIGPDEVIYSLSSSEGGIVLAGAETRVQGSRLALIVETPGQEIEFGTGVDVDTLFAANAGNLRVTADTLSGTILKAEDQIILASACVPGVDVPCEGSDHQGDLELLGNLTLEAPDIVLNAGSLFLEPPGKGLPVVTVEPEVRFQLETSPDTETTQFSVQQTGNLSNRNLPTADQFVDWIGKKAPMSSIDTYSAISFQESIEITQIEDLRAAQLNLIAAEEVHIQRTELGPAQLENTFLSARSIRLEATDGSVDAKVDGLELYVSLPSDFGGTFEVRQSNPFDQGQTGLPELSQFTSFPTSQSPIDYKLTVTSEGAGVLVVDPQPFGSLTAQTNLFLQSGENGSVEIATGFEAAESLYSLNVNTDTGVEGTSIVLALPQGDDGSIESFSDQTYGAPVILKTDAPPPPEPGGERSPAILRAGGDIRFTDSVLPDVANTRFLSVEADGAVRFEAGVGRADQRLGSLEIHSSTFEGADPVAIFGLPAEEGTPAAPVAVYTDGDIELFAEGRSSIPATATVFRPDADPASTEGTPDLLFDSENGSVIMGRNEKLSVPGVLVVKAAEEARVGDLSALELYVEAPTITLVRRGEGPVLHSDGSVGTDGGVDYVANTMVFDGAINLAGSGQIPAFGLPNPFLRPAFVAAGRFPTAAINIDNTSLSAGEFIASGESNLLDLQPLGASSADLAEAFWIPTPIPFLTAPPEKLVPDPAALIEIGIALLPTSIAEYQSRLHGAGLLDDVDSGVRLAGAPVWVSEARVLPKDANQALAAYRRVLGLRRENAGQIRDVLQTALDDYRSLTGARRVVGFEFRRYLKNRPSSQFKAYVTLEDLDSLFLHQRRSGLVATEYEHIQKAWLEEITPDGITADELSQAIFPSRYVRGSEILDVYGE